jgi:hypothetical protein
MTRSTPRPSISAGSESAPRSARSRGGAAESLTLADRIKVEREHGRIHITLTRKYVRHVYLSDDEADYLRTLLSRFVSPVVVSRTEVRGQP